MDQSGWLPHLDSFLLILSVSDPEASTRCVKLQTSSLMMVIVIRATDTGITVVVVMLGQVRLAGLDVLMGAGCSEKSWTICCVNPAAHVRRANETSRGIFILTGQMILSFLSRGMLRLNDSA